MKYRHSVKEKFLFKIFIAESSAGSKHIVEIDIAEKPKRQKQKDKSNTSPFPI